MKKTGRFGSNGYGKTIAEVWNTQKFIKNDQFEKPLHIREENRWDVEPPERWR